MVQSIKYYLNNPNLRSENYHHNYTLQEIQEFIKCKNDPIYFIKTYCKIVHVDLGFIPFELFDFQEDMIRSFAHNRDSIVLAARQIGKSTTVAAFFCWYVIFHEDKNCAILANKAAGAREILYRFQRMYEALPFFLQQGVKVWNKGSIELENGSRIMASSTSSTAIRGAAISLLFLDEFAFVQAGTAEEFFTSVYPTISSGKETKTIITSTPNGYNLFYRMWNDAINNMNQFNPIFVHWSDVPGRDEAWRLRTLSILGEDKFEQEMNAEFCGSSNTLIKSRYIKTMSSDKYIYCKEGLTVYKNAEENHQYIVMCDVARGTGNDNSAYIVVDITEYPFKIVAKYINNQISTQILPTYLYQTAKSYNNALVLIETNDNGQQVADILFYDLEYEEVVFMIGNKQPGCRTTKSTKRLGCSIFKDMIESQKLIINDSDIISEISTFVQQGEKGYAAEAGTHDDLVMCLVMLGFFTTRDEFKINSDVSLRKELIEQKHKDIEEDLLPFGIFDDGESVEYGDDNDNWLI